MGNCFQLENFSDINTVGFNLFKTQYSLNKDNLALNPVSIYLSLAMLAEGLNGETKKELMKFLNLDDEYNLLHPTKIAELREYITNSCVNDYNFYNSLWIDEKNRINQVFSNILKSKHGVNINQIGFAKPESNRQINGFSIAKGFSRKVIENIKLDYKVLMMSLSSYKVCWQTKFNVNRSIVDEFRISTQRNVRVKYLIDYKSVCVIERIGHQYCSIALSDPGYCFVLSMPNVGYNPIRGLKLQFVLECTGYGMERTKIQLPEFNWESNLNLNQCLSKCGASSLFYSSSSQDFKAISDGMLWLSEFIHNTTVEINERGGGSIIGGKPIPVQLLDPKKKEKMNLEKSIKFDRPFAYFVVDTQRSLVLLSGVLKVPQEAMSFM